MTTFRRQLRYLLWKNILIKKRQKVWLAIELLVPVLLFAILALVRTRDFTIASTHCHYDSKAFPSAGLLPFVHSLLCSISNECNLSPTTGDETAQINNATAQNESIVVDFLYYSTMQLNWIGKHPVEFQKFAEEVTSLINLIADMNMTSFKVPTQFNHLFRDPAAASNSTAASLNLPPELTAKLFTATPQQEFFRQIENVPYDPISLIFGSSTDILPLMCDRAIFEQSFTFPNGTSFSNDELDQLCDIQVYQWADAFANLTADSNNHAGITLTNGSSIPYSDLIPKILTLLKLQDQPIFEAIQKWKEITWDSIVKYVFCGVDPTSTSLNGMVQPSGSDQSKIQTPFDKMQKKLVEYIEKVVPGEESDQNKTCLNVTVHHQNCSSIDSFFLRQLKPMLQGYILVTPDNSAVRELVNLLNEPLRLFAYVRDQLFDYPEMAPDLQLALQNSQLNKAAENILLYLNGSHPLPPILSPLLKPFKFFLEHAFKGIDDPYSLGNLTGSAVRQVDQFLDCVLVDRFRIVSNASELEETAVCLQQYGQYFSGLVFDFSNSTGEYFTEDTTYQIRHVSSMVDTTNDVTDGSRNIFDRNMPFRDLKYITYGFSFLQEAVDRALIELTTGIKPEMGIYAQQEPYPCVFKDSFNVENFLGLFVLLSFIVPAMLLVKNIVYEKEQKLKEHMRIMGLGDAIHFLSWASVSFVLNIVSVILISVLLVYGNIYPHTDITLLLVFFTLFVFSSISFSALLTTFFTNANISAAVTCVIYFLFFYPFYLSKKNKDSTFTKFTLILPQSALGYGTLMLGKANEIDEAHWSEFHKIWLKDYGIGLTSVFVALACQTVFCLIAAWYISAIFPGAYGVGRKWYFPFTLSYWLPSSRGNEVNDIGDQFESIPASDSFESEPVGQKMTVHISGLSKIYSNGTKALDNLHLRLYESSITALLGHNGAGKTTTMSLLCGFYKPSSGTARIYGFDIRSDLRRVRNVLGLCPQHNVLFTHLTVAEQLKFFAVIKGASNSEVNQQVDEILESVSLTHKRDALAGTLSGGMKRRLSIGIALIGGSKFVILDEPTAGVDVTARKEIWKLLQRNKTGRTILLSTHHMDEADVLSDRIAILSEGKLVSLGSSVFLKNRYGQNLNLIICKNERSGVYNPAIEEILSQPILSIQFLDENEDELIFLIPIDIDSETLEKFFVWLDTRCRELNLGDYGISAPNLQQIFIRLAPQREYQVQKAERFVWISKLRKKFQKKKPEDKRNLIPCPSSGSSLAATSSSLNSNNSASTSHSTENVHEAHTNGLTKIEELDSSSPRLAGWCLFWSHFKALITCRVHWTKRSLFHFFYQVIVPILLILSCEAYIAIQNLDSTAPEGTTTAQNNLPLVRPLFGDTTDVYISLWDRNSSSLSYRMTESLLKPPGLGVRCVDDGYLQKVADVTCDFGAAEGEFDFGQNGTDIDYNEQNVYCACSPTADFGWNCTSSDFPMGDLPMLRLNTSDRVWDLSYRNISQMRMTTRRNKKDAVNGAIDDLFFLGGFSLGHISLRASQMNSTSEKIGWADLIVTLRQSAEELKINYTGEQGNQTHLNDPFTQGINMTVLVDTLIDNMETKENVKVWFNNKVWPSVAIQNSEITNALLRAISIEDATHIEILTYNNPMNRTVKDAFDSATIQKVVTMRVIVLILTLCMIPAAFIQFIIEDRVSDSLHLQIVSGLRKRTYWIAGFVYDLSIYILAVIVIMLIYLIFGIKDFTYDPQIFGAYVLLFIVYGISAIQYAYILQRMFTIPALAFIIIFAVLFFIGTVLTMTVFVIEQLMKTDPTLYPAHQACSYSFLVLPQYCLGMAIYRGAYIYQLFEIGKSYLNDLHRSDLVNDLPLPYVLEWDLMGMYIVVLVGHIAISFWILVFLESKSVCGWRRLWEVSITNRLLSQLQQSGLGTQPEGPSLHTAEDDLDVQKEKERVEALAEEVHETGRNMPLVVRDLAKAYGRSRLAVKGVSFAVDKGECFGLLGLNGAGKTTCFGMLTGKILPGAGSVDIQGYSVTSGDSKGFKQLGYCPQFDALNMKLTTKENMIFFARIRGIPNKDIESLVSRILLSLHLSPYANTVSGELSGGNRRKLSVAVALISQPTLILLDEPSAGMDPGSQQFLWRVIELLRKSGKAVVITSHSMEECEFLCTRIAIMDQGKIRCIGSKQHLKNKFGEGYSLIVKLRNLADVQEAAEYLNGKIQGIQLIHCCTIFIRIHRSKSSIADILHIVNEMKQKWLVEDFSLSQATLDEVFQSLAETSKP